MKLLIKQRVFSWTASYDIYDEAENVKYYVKGDASGYQLRVFDVNNREIGMVRRKHTLLTSQFEIEMRGRLLGTIRQEATFCKPKFDVDFNGWHVEGDFACCDYDVLAGNSSIIHIKKEIWHWGGTYVIDFANPADELMGLMLVIAIDATSCSAGNPCY